MKPQDALAAALFARYSLGHVAFPCGEDTEVEAASILAALDAYGYTLVPVGLVERIEAAPKMGGGDVLDLIDRNYLRGDHELWPGEATR